MIPCGSYVAAVRYCTGGMVAHSILCSMFATAYPVIFSQVANYMPQPYEEILNGGMVK